jgi:chorismate dehydratase
VNDRGPEDRGPEDRGPGVRVGGIDYLNALPLTSYLSDGRDPPLHVSNHVPSRLADLLRSGQLDVALVPAIEYLSRDSYRLLPGICISSYGGVQSIRLYLRCRPQAARRVGLDARSRSSAMLARLLFRELWGACPEFEQFPSLDVPAESALEAAEGLPSPAAAKGLDGVLLIGDAALSLGTVPGWESLDLGTEWTRWTGLPFVYAFWVWGGGPAPPGLTDRFIHARARGLVRIDEIVTTARLPAGFGPAACRRYLSRTIQYNLGPVQIEGCLEYYARLERAGLVSAAPRGFRFLEDGTEPDVPADTT